MVTLGMDLLSRENSCSSFWAALVGWKVPGLPDLSWKEVGEEEVTRTDWWEVVKEEGPGLLEGDREMGIDLF